MSRRIAGFFVTGLALAVCGGTLAAQAGSRTPRARGEPDFRREALEESQPPRKVNAEQLQRLADSLQDAVGRQQQLAYEFLRLRKLAMAGPSDSVEREQRSLNEAMRTVIRNVLRLQSRYSALCGLMEQPEGWMGVAFSGPYRMLQKTSGSPVTFRFQKYPVVEAVEPASPASRAGVEVGDTIVAFDEDDIQNRDVVFAMLLKPGNPLSMTVRHGEGPRTMRLKIERRPGAAPSGCSAMRFAVTEALLNPAIEQLPRIWGSEPTTTDYTIAVRGTPPMPGRGSVAARAPAGMAAPRAPVPALADVPDPYMYVISSSSTVLAGAELVRMDPEVLWDTFGARHGVLISRVGRGTPAMTAGLLAGDVIVGADGAEILSSIGLQRALADADEKRWLKLTVMRKKKMRSVTLKW